MSLFRKSSGRIRREASQWVVRLGEHANAEDHAAFRRWRDADPRHAEAYDRIASIWNQAGRLSHSSVTGGELAERRHERPRAFAFALAASLAAIALVSVLLLGSRLLPGSASHREPMVFTAALGDIRSIDLADGSRLTLDSASKVEAALSGAQRTLTLIEGRARFQVAHEARPFVVRAGSSEVVATGTLFDVSLIGGRTDVVLLRGSVEVRTRGNRTVERLRPGQKLILTGAEPAERRQATRADSAWPTRMLEFDNMRLDEAAARANRYSKVQLKLADERIRGLRVSGAFRAGDAAGLARSLAAAFNLRIVAQPDGNLLLVDAGQAARPPAK